MMSRVQSTSRVALGLFSVAVLLSGIYFARQSGSDPSVYSNDFNVYYHAASEVIAGRDPYQSVLTEWTPYLYPPLLSELMTPLAFLPLRVAAYIWFVIGALSVASAAWMSAALCDQTRDSPPGKPAFVKSKTNLLAVIGFVFLIRFALDNFNLGQVNTVVAALCVAHVYCYAKNKKTLSAFALAVAVSIKLTPLVFIAYHLAKRRFKFALVCLGLLAAMTTVSFLPFGGRGPETFKVFVNRTVKNEQGFGLAQAGNQSLRGTVARVIEGDGSGESERKPVSVLTLVISIILLFIAVIAAFIARSELAAVAPFFCCLVMLSPLSWKAHFIVLILPVIFLICRALQSSKPRRGYLMTALAIVFGLFNLTSPKVIGLTRAEWSDAHALVFAGSLLLFIACVWQASRRFVNLNRSDYPETD